MFSVVDEQHYVRKFYGCVLSYFKARRDSVENYALRRAHVGVGRVRKAIVFEVDCKHYAEPRYAACRGAFAHDETVFEGFENSAVEILSHGAVDIFNPFFFVVVFEIRFGENEFERAFCIAHVAFEFVPILPLGSELVASDDRPFFMLATVRHEYIATSYGFHLNLPFLRIMPPILRLACASLSAIAVGEMPYASSISSLSLSMVI